MSNNNIKFNTRIIFPDNIEAETQVIEQVIITLCLLPVDVIDISFASPSINLVKAASQKAQNIFTAHFNDKFQLPLIQASVKCSDYLQDENIFSTPALKDIDMFELNINIQDDEAILNAFTAMISAQAIKDFYTVNLNRKHHSNSQLKMLIDKFYELVPNDALHICVNGDEEDFDSCGDDYFNAVQAIATCDILLKDLKIRHRKKYKNLKIYLTDEVNQKTIALARLCELDLDGFSFGSHSSEAFLGPLIQELANSSLSSLNSYNDYNDLIKLCIENFMDYNFNFYNYK